MANDVRFRWPNVISRNQTLVYTNLSFYGAYTTCLTEIAAYDAAGNYMGLCFSDGDNFMQATSNAVSTWPIVVPRTIGLLWVFDSQALATQAVTIHLWLYSAQGVLLDAY